MNSSWRLPILIVIVVLVLACCLCVIGLAFAGLAVSAVEWTSGLDPRLDSGEPTATPQLVRPPGPVISAPPFQGTLRTLEETIVPPNDLRSLAQRLEGRGEIPLTLPPPLEPLTTGAQETFWVTNLDTNESFQVSATLRYVTDHLYFWIEDGVRYDAGELAALAETFENEIYPTNRDFFGSEWSPGVDGDPHLYALLARGLGIGLAGYFSSVDEVHPLAHEFSNGHEMFVLNADNIDLGESFTYSVLAHEFQHMIHWYRDQNEESWLNEGFSELAAFLNGYDLGGFDDLYASNPDLQLTDWPNDPNQTSPHYGASSLFLTYFLDRFGSSATQALVAHPENGLVSVDATLAEIGTTDPLTGEPVRADDVFLDWVIASYLDDPAVADGRYTYSNYPEAPRTAETERLARCPTGDLTRDVRQYGVDYLRITCPGDYTLQFEGSTQVKLLPADPYSGDTMFWSNKGDESDMTLTRRFDFRDHDGPLTLTYWTWYDLEEDYDYLYLEASLDGESWQILTTPSGTADDPTGNSYGWAYNGLSDQGPVWIQEQVDLTPFAGQQVQIRFEYITDAAVNGEGFLLDDVAVPEIDYFTDFEKDDGGWQAEGFVRVQNALPQAFRLALISHGANPTVTPIELADDNTIEIPLTLDRDVQEVTLVVTGTTRFTRQPAVYRLAITP